MNFIQSFIIGTIDLIKLLPFAVMYIAPRLVIFSIFMIAITITGVFDLFIDVISLEWANLDDVTYDMRGFGS